MRGGKRVGAGRKPGLKTKPIRIPILLIKELEKRGNVKDLIIKSCSEKFNIKLEEK